MPKQVVVLVREKERQYEALRSTLGLLLENHTVSMIVLDNEVQMSEEYKDNMELLDEVGGARYSNVEANIRNYGFQMIGMDELAEIIKKADLVIPF